MKKLRYLYLGVSLILTIGISAPTTLVFAETRDVMAHDMVLNDDGVSDIKPEVGAEKNDEDEEDKANDEILPLVSEIEDGIKVSNIAILSYNPGFSDPYVGEFLELKKLPTNFILLAGLTIIYETSSGSEYTILEFSEEHEMVGESLLLRLASSDEVKNTEDATSVADAIYTRNMSQSAGRIKLEYAGEEIDSLCWGLKETGCYSVFKTGKKNPPTTLVRKIDDEEIGDFEFISDYVPNFNPLHPSLLTIEIPEEIVEPQCRTLEFTELYTYFETTSAEQFVEIYNNSDEEIKLDGCTLNYKGRNYLLSGILGIRKYLAIYPYTAWGIVMTKNPTSANRLSLIDIDGETVDSLVYYSGQKKGVSLAKFGLNDSEDINWKQTYNITAGLENIYQQFKTCPVGKVINIETGNCVNEVQPVVTLAACPEGKYRNPLTGRCKSYTTTASTELKPCAEGYERNPETNRCRKIVTNTGSDYPVATGTFEEKKDFTSIFAIATVIVAGLGYIAFQYKEELKMKLRPAR